MSKVSCERLNHWSWCSLTLQFDVFNMWKMRYPKKWVHLSPLQFFYLEIQTFLDYSSTANFYQHIILSRMIYNLHNFFEKTFFWKNGLTWAVMWLSRVSPSKFCYKPRNICTKLHVSSPLSVLKYHIFFQVNSPHLETMGCVHYLTIWLFVERWHFHYY